MPVFISYSHADSVFANTLAAHLVKNNAHVWIDSWELNVGDSILAHVQKAIQESSALLIILSKASVESAWVKKELNAGLMRELDEKKVLVLPVLLEDCEIPMFLREKMYADFRTNFDAGLSKLVDALLRITNTDQGRIASGASHIDWSQDWAYENGLLRMDYTLIEYWDAFPFTVLTQISLCCNDALTRKYEEYREAGLAEMGRLAIAEGLADVAESADIKILLQDQHPQVERRRWKDARTNLEYRVVISCRRLGEDNGKDQLVNVGNYLRQIRDYLSQRVRKPTPEQAERLTKMRDRTGTMGTDRTFT